MTRSCSAYDKVSGLSLHIVRPLPKLTCHVSELTGHRMYLNFCTWCLLHCYPVALRARTY